MQNISLLLSSKVTYKYCAGAPLMFLSGSFRTAWEVPFQQAFGPNIQVLRESTTVPANTQYCVHLLSATSNLQDCQKFCAEHIKEAAKTSTAFKCMVFVPLVWHVNDTAATFRKQIEPSAVFTYLASDPPADQVSCYQRWLRSANLAIFICTHAGAVGIDPPPSVKVYHLGAVWSMVSMFQAAGRSGRGSAGSSTFITSHNTLHTFFRNNDVSEAVAQQIEG
jgi:superfamily II DNA helicase RecQ